MNNEFSEYETESTTSRGSRSSRDSQRSRHSSQCSQDSISIGWTFLCEFEEIDQVEHFLRIELPRNATPSSRQPVCEFYNKLTDPKHKNGRKIR